jgi:uncharacterized protein YuzE
MTIRLKYDLNAGALYIRLSDAEVARTCEAGGNAAVDLDASGAAVGIEVRSAAQPWPLAEILASYTIPADQGTLLTSYFTGRYEVPRFSSAARAAVGGARTRLICQYAGRWDRGPGYRLVRWHLRRMTRRL